MAKRVWNAPGLKKKYNTMNGISIAFLVLTAVVVTLSKSLSFWYVIGALLASLLFYVLGNRVETQDKRLGIKNKEQRQ